MHCMRRGPGVVHLGNTDLANRAQHARRARGVHGGAWRRSPCPGGGIQRGRNRRIGPMRAPRPCSVCGWPCWAWGAARSRTEGSSGPRGHFDLGGPNTPLMGSVLWGTRSVRAPRRPFEKVGVRLDMPMARSTRSWGASNTNSSRRADPFSRPSRRFARSKRREGPERIGHVGPTRGLTRAELHVAPTHTHTNPSSAG